MTPHTPSGQQAVDAPTFVAPACWYIDHGSYGQITMRQDEASRALAEGKAVTAYIPRPVSGAIRTAAPTAPSTAASALDVWNFRVACNLAPDRDWSDDELDGVTLGLRKAIRAALATPPAQVGEHKNLIRALEVLANKPADESARGMISTYIETCRLAVIALSTPPAPSVPWEERAAQIRRDALEEAAQQADAWGFGLVGHRIRALLSKPAKGE